MLEPGAQFGETFAAILLKILALKPTHSFEFVLAGTVVNHCDLKIGRGLCMSRLDQFANPRLGFGQRQTALEMLAA